MNTRLEVFPDAQVPVLNQKPPNWTSRMGNVLAVIDRFLDIFSRYIDSGFGLISGDVGFLVKVLIGIDVVLAALAWAAGEDEVIQAFARKVLYIGLFAFFLNNWNQLAGLIFKSFAALGLKATGASLS